MEATMKKKEILLKLCASLTLADHMGDVARSVIYALELAKIDLDHGDGNEDWNVVVGEALHKLGVTTLHNSSIGVDEDA
jgi:hypothetical protein